MTSGQILLKVLSESGIDLGKEGEDFLECERFMLIIDEFKLEHETKTF